MIEVRWQGRGGQGGFTAARLLGLSASLFEGKYALAFPTFGPERRGAPVQAFTRIDAQKITDRSAVKFCDYIVVLDETLVHEDVFGDLKPGGIILINSKFPEKYRKSGRNVVTLDATSLAWQVLKKPITNTAMLGALLGASGIIGLESAVQGIQKELPPPLVQKNIDILTQAYGMIKEGRV